jgi:nucleotide-binding universal stress UspA family protein
VRGLGRVVVGASGSPGSLRALRLAEALARAHHAVLVPVLAWESPASARFGRIQSSDYLSKECQEIAGRQLRDTLTAVWGQVPDDPMIKPHVERGPAGWVLVNLASRPDDLLVVGAGRRGPLDRMAGARVSRYCVAYAPCPVLTVPPSALARALRGSPLTGLLRHRTLTAEMILRDQGTRAT